MNLLSFILLQLYFNIINALIMNFSMKLKYEDDSAVIKLNQFKIY